MDTRFIRQYKKTATYFKPGYEASNFTRVPLQPSCAGLRYQLSNELSTVTALGQ